MKYKSMFLSWLRAALASAGALYMTGTTDPKILSYALLSGFIGPVMKWLDTSAVEFGRTK
jgi:capsid protein